MQRTIQSSRPFKRYHQHQGFSLIAIMISAGIGVFLLLSMTQLIAISRTGYNTSNEIARMYDNARFAISYLTNQISLASRNFYDDSGEGYGGVWPNGGRIPGGYPYLAGDYNTAGMYIPGFQSIGCRGSNTSWASPWTNSSSPGDNIFGNILTAGGFGGSRPDTVALRGAYFPNSVASAPGLRFFYLATQSWGNIIWQPELITSKMQRSLFTGNESTNVLCYGGYGFQPQGVQPTSCCDNAADGWDCTPLGGTNTYNCGGSEGLPPGKPDASGNGLHAGWIYERVIPHIQPANGTFTGTTVGSGTINGLRRSDTLTIAFSNKSGSSMNNCTNGTIPSATGTDLGQLAYSTFSVGLWQNTAAADTTCTTLDADCFPNLQCQPQIANIGKEGTTPGTQLPLVEGVEYMKILLGEDDFGERDYTGDKATSPSRWINANEPTIDWTNIVAVRIALVIRSAQPILSNDSQPTLFLMRGQNGTALTYTPIAPDSFMRKVFVFTIPLSEFTHRDYPTPSGTPVINAPNTAPYPANVTYADGTTYNGATTPYNYTNGMDYERHCVGMTASQVASYPPRFGANGSTGIAGGFVLKVGGVRTKYLDGRDLGTQQFLQPGDRCCASDIPEVNDVNNLYQYTGSGPTTGFQCRVYRNLIAWNACEIDRTWIDNGRCRYFWTVPDP